MSHLCIPWEQKITSCTQFLSALQGKARGKIKEDCQGGGLLKALAPLPLTAKSLDVTRIASSLNNPPPAPPKPATLP